jgi:hypothetical protein
VGNAILTSVSGISTLDSVGDDFRVYNNPSLPTCAATGLASSVTVGGATTISGNLPDSCS